MDNAYWSIEEFNPGSPESLFVLESETGILGVNDKSPAILRSYNLNHEVFALHMLGISVADNGGLMDTASVSISIQNIPEPPVFIESPLAEIRKVAENSIIGSICGDPLLAIDDDYGQSALLKFNISEDASMAFSVDHITGQISTNTMLDFETQENYLVVVNVSDPQGLTLQLSYQ
jgi:hypothetical protein